MGELEARKLKFATTGTEAILMGILVEGLFRFPFLIFVLLHIVLMHNCGICCSSCGFRMDAF